MSFSPVPLEDLMSRAHLRLQKTIQPYTDSLNELVKAIPPVTNKLAVYPAVRGLLFPGEEGKRTFKYLSPRVHTFDMMAKNATKVAESVLNQAHRYLRTIAEMYAPLLRTTSASFRRTRQGRVSFSLLRARSSTTSTQSLA